MTHRPSSGHAIRKITILEPQITQITLGRLAALVRPAGGELADLAPGDLLWVREPFRFKAKYDDWKPTDCVELGAAVHFSAGQPASEIPRLNLGKPRYARNLPRVCHRQHLEVTAVETRPLQAMTDSGAVMEGFANLASWIDAWDRSVGLDRARGVKWNDNPEVLHFTFTRHNRPACLRPSTGSGSTSGQGPEGGDPGEAPADADATGDEGDRS